ncbi:MAG: hypothetical protein ABW156_08260, partial [Jiangellaceae bacterium]
ATTPVHNFTVAEHHTYYVSAGRTPVLVHNDPKCDTALGIGVPQGGLRLSTWAENRNFQHYMGPEYRQGTPPAWRGNVMLDVEDPAKRIHVRLNDFRGYGQRARDRFVMAVRNGGVQGAEARATEEEMAWLAKAIYQKKRRWDTVFFYDEQGDVARFSEPDWWNLVSDEPERSAFQRWLDRGRWYEERSASK